MLETKVLTTSIKWIPTRGGNDLSRLHGMLVMEGTDGNGTHVFHFEAFESMSEDFDESREIANNVDTQEFERWYHAAGIADMAPSTLRIGVRNYLVFASPGES